MPDSIRSPPRIHYRITVRGHRSVVRYEGQDEVNPTAMILSGRMMLEHLGWDDAADLVRDAVEETLSSGKVTYDLERQLDDAEKLATSEYADEVVSNIEKLSETVFRAVRTCSF